MRSIDYFDKGADLYPDRDCIIEGDRKWSFSQVKSLTERIARAMYANGFENQQQVALYSPNSADVLIALLAIWRANGVWIPVNTRNAIDANAAYLNYVGCTWLIYDSSLEADVAELKSRTPGLTNFVCLDKPHDGAPSMDAFIDGVDDGPLPIVENAFGNLDELVGIFPTGGTTGPSKGVNVNNLGWGTMLQTAGHALGGRTDNPVNLVVAPITHAAGPVALATMSFGATQVIMPGFDADKVLANIETYQVSHMYLPPTALYGLLGSAELGKRDVSSLRIFVLVGSPVSPEKFRQGVEAFGPVMCQSYGQMECPMFVTWLPPELAAAAANGDHPERLASCGRPTGAIRVGIMDDDGKLLPNGERGEIVVRGALVSHSYFQKPDATAEIRTHGWHHTGDIGYRDDDGFIYIVDRKKDMVITGGFNVFTAEVEAAITELSQVRECAVFGVPHDKWGEQVHAEVIADGVTEAEIIAHAKARLGSVKAPKSVAFITEIPRTPAGKMDKKVLRARHWAGDRLVN